ncbi:condensin complex subunit 2/barren [Cyathus striatus]|nr:condensin complex subunit 2/barren [Cyathus striatus]
MPPKRRARSPKDSQPLYTEDTDHESEQDTPKAHKLKKRVSEAYLAEGDSNAPDGARVPLRSVNINDDAAEKRRRRKSTRIAVIDSLPGPSTDGVAGGTDQEGESSRAAKQKQPLNAVALPISNFEEWMKMATDNKINAANSWNFALIDYFHDMSLLRNNDDNSINFQRASCTLDGCVKIWTSRVDSVGTETGKLLSNLANEGRDEDDDGNGSDNPDADPTQAKKKKSHKPTATLVKDKLQLQNKKLELEFSVDPLFKKTCADFDEGGAQGLLMNHLSLGWGSEGALRIIFDASDGKGRVEVEEDLGDEPEDEIDLTYLRSQFLPDLNTLEAKAISHSLDGFSFAKDAFSFDESLYADNTHRNDDSDDEDNEPGADFDFNSNDAGAAPEDYFVGADAVGEDYAGDFGGGDFGGGGGGDEFGSGEGGSAGPSREGEEGRGFVPFDPRRAPNDRNLVMAMADTDETGGLDYFDQTFLKNWAGPEHWKLRKIIRRAEANPATNGEAKAVKGRGKKESFKIDFLVPQEKDLREQQKELFAPVGKGASINLPKKKQEKKDEHMLPDDMHFSSRQLVTLFLKPKFFLKMRGKKAKMDEHGDEVDVDFWAQAAAGNAVEGNQDDDEGGAAIPFNTQFFHDDDDDDGPGFDDTYDGAGAGVDAGEQDLLAATQGQTRRVRPEFVNYAKRAKRVDVRKLKDNIWKGLDIVISKTKEEDDEGMDIDGEEPVPPPTDPSESRQFKQVISGLQRSYPKDKMEEISTSFCFICLLHLANEQGLKLESAVDPRLMEEKELVEEEEEVSTEKKVGNIWDIKIYRDPNATQAA